MINYILRTIRWESRNVRRPLKTHLNCLAGVPVTTLPLSYHSRTKLNVPFDGKKRYQ